MTSATTMTNNAGFVFEFDGFDSQITRAIEQLDWFNSLGIEKAEAETTRAITKLKKLAKKFETSDEDDFEGYVNQFFGIMKNWAHDIISAHDEHTDDVNGVMEYSNFEVIKIEEGSSVSDNAKYIGKVFKITDVPVGIVMNRVYAYRCDYIADDVQDYFVARADVVVK